MCVCVRMNVSRLCLPAGWEIIHILSEPCVGSVFWERAATCACSDSFVVNEQHRSQRRDHDRAATAGRPVLTPSLTAQDEKGERVRAPCNLMIE